MNPTPQPLVQIHHVSRTFKRGTEEIQVLADGTNPLYGRFARESATAAIEADDNAPVPVDLALSPMRLVADGGSESVDQTFQY